MKIPTKQGGFWSFLGIAIICYVPLYCIQLAIDKFCINPIFNDMINNNMIDYVRQFTKYERIRTALEWAISLIVQILTMYLATNLYAKIRIITEELAKGISLVYLIVGAFFTLYPVTIICIYRDQIGMVFNLPIDILLSVTLLIIPLIFLRKMLLGKVANNQDSFDLLLE